MAKCFVSGLDYSYEGVTTNFNMTDLTAANFDAQVAGLGAVQSAIQGVSLITYDGSQYVGFSTARESAQPASPYAQRESKWLVSFTDNVTGDAGSFEIGGPDLTLVGPDGSTMVIDSGAGQTLVTAIENWVLSKAGNAVTVSRVVHVGRNN